MFCALYHEWQRLHGAGLHIGCIPFLLSVLSKIVAKVLKIFRGQPKAEPS